jgi:Ca2+:H+ antiporter
LRRHTQLERAEASSAAWPFPLALTVLGVATLATAIVSEVLVHTLKGFASAIGASEFFIAAVIVAIVGNAAEHGGAIVIARAGKMKLASEIAISSSAQVALLVAPVVMLLSLLFTHELPLTFRWEELAAMAAAVVLAAATIANGRSSRREGAFLIVAYVLIALGFLAAGNR